MKRIPEQPLKETEGDTLAMLSTQDSEGLWVIAHCALLSRSPLKDQTKVLASGSDSRCAADKTLQEEGDAPRETQLVNTNNVYACI
jgi:hypothetical protein